MRCAFHRFFRVDIGPKFRTHVWLACLIICFRQSDTLPAVKKKPKRMRLTAAQSRSWIQFNYYSFENPKLTFEQVALKVLGRNPFPRTPQGRKFEQERRKVFDREREA